MTRPTKIMLFLCNWGPHAAFLSLQDEKRDIPEEVLMLRVPCTGRALGASSPCTRTMSPTRVPIGASKMRPSGNVASTLVRGRPGRIRAPL